jgi:hypothetical protein
MKVNLKNQQSQNSIIKKKRFLKLKQNTLLKNKSLKIRENNIMSNVAEGNEEVIVVIVEDSVEVKIIAALSIIV